MWLAGEDQLGSALRTPPFGKQRCLADLRLVQPHPTRWIYRTAETLDAAAYQQVCWATASSARPPLWQAWRPVDFRHTLGARAGPPSAASEGNRLTHQTGRGIPPHAGQRAQEHRANTSQVHGVSHALPGLRPQEGGPASAAPQPRQRGSDRLGNPWWRTFRAL